ncbi:MAG: hypothetical protein GY936_06785 [Ignavibacteriae bacterium]|nr:hypothetical protein [Ignavibacteriota bacterium]
MSGYDRTKNKILEFGEKEPIEIINGLKNAGTEWMQNLDQDDDITFVVIKVK